MLLISRFGNDTIDEKGKHRGRLADMRKGLYAVASDVNIYDDILKLIISALSDENTCWHVDCLDYCAEIPDFSGKNTPDELMEVFNSNPLILFARMMATNVGEAPNRDIIVGEDYEASNCHSVVICVDAGCFEVFSKDKQKLETLYQKISKENPFKLCWTGEDYGGRTDFRVY